MDGKDYIFVSKATFESWIESKQLLEHAVVYKEYKGIPREQASSCAAAARAAWHAWA